MTVTYTREVATCGGISCFLKLLLRWRGSIYKLVYIDLVFFLGIYYALNLTYRFILNDTAKELFVNIVKYCNASNNYIPLSFVLGFYVSIVMTRWWNQYSSIPLPDAIAVYVSATIHGQDERGRVMRRTIMRYVCLSVTILFTNISMKVKKRFPTLDHLVNAGLLEISEKDVIEKLNNHNKKFQAYSKHWLPLVWAASIITRARKEGRIRDDFAVKTMLDEINVFRGKCGKLLNFDRISIPLVYTQVVTLAVYSYFLTTLMGHQWVDGHGYKFELHFPIFTLLQFFFYMGWLKVAESLINPFGDDDDDFELNWMVDRNLQISYLIVDEMHHAHPELIKDQYWNEVFPEELPYTPETQAFKESHPLPSTANIFAQYSKDDGFVGHSMFKLDDLGSNPIMFKARPFNNKHYGSQQSVRTKSGSLLNLARRFLMRSESVESEAHQEMMHQIPKHVIADVIEEVDEQLTIMSRREESARPTVMDIFGNAEDANKTVEPTKNQSSASKEDDFDLLRHKREEERLKRIKDNLKRYLDTKDE